MAKLIHLIGTSNSGKGTVHKKINSELESKGYTIESIIEPGPLREYTKTYRQKPEADRDIYTELALFTADRFISYEKQVFPRMNNDNLVFTFDRGLPDTVVYQGIIGGVDVDLIMRMNSHIPKSDLYLCLVVDGAEGYQRALKKEKETREAPTKSEMPDEINKRADAYKQIPKYFPNTKIIDTTKLNEKEVFDQCMIEIGKTLQWPIRK